MKEKLFKIKFYGKNDDISSFSAFISAAEKKRFITNASPNPWILVTGSRGNDSYVNTNEMIEIIFEEVEE